MEPATALFKEYSIRVVIGTIVRWRVVKIGHLNRIAQVPDIKRHGHDGSEQYTCE